MVRRRPAEGRNRPEPADVPVVSASAAAGGSARYNRGMTLEEAKSLVSDKYLGVAGIHGVGLKRKQDAISLYVEDEHDARLADALSEVKKAVQPYRVVVVPAQRPDQMR